MRHIIFDTDMGIDDALALFLVLSSPEVKLEAITTVMGTVLQPDLITWKPACVDVELASSLTLGATIAQFESSRSCPHCPPELSGLSVEKNCYCEVCL